MADRKADELAGKGSFLDMLRGKRKEAETKKLNPEDYMAEQPEPTPTADDRRGYTKDKWES